MTEEYVSGGHVVSAKNVPLVFPKSDPKGPSKPGWPLVVPGDPNPNFIAEVQDVCWPEGLILVIYVTGGRGEASSAADHIAGELVEHAPVLGRFPTVAFIGGIGIEPARCSGECVLTR